MEANRIFFYNLIFRAHLNSHLNFHLICTLCGWQISYIIKINILFSLHFIAVPCIVLFSFQDTTQLEDYSGLINSYEKLCDFSNCCFPFHEHYEFSILGRYTHRYRDLTFYLLHVLCLIPSYFNM